MSHKLEDYNPYETEEEVAYTRCNGINLKTSENNLSMINKFHPQYSGQSTDFGKEIVQRLVDNVLLDKAGLYDGSSTECSSLKISSEPSSNSPRDIGQRISYWKKYLQENVKITEKLSRVTGKEPADLLINRNEEQRRIQQCKTIMDAADRLEPNKLDNRKAITTKKIPCVPDIYETLPLQERLAKPTFTITEKPQIAFHEIGLEGLKIHQSSWLHSSYLGKRVVEQQWELERVLDHYPEMEKLQVIGTKILPTQPKKSSCEKEKDTDHVDFRITDAWYRPKEPTLEYVIAIDEREFDAEYVLRDNVNFYFTFQCKPCEQQIRKLNIRNKGWKAVDVGWAPIRQRQFRGLPPSSQVIPAFYFNKNLTRIQPGSSITIDFVFCCKLFGIHEELWEIKLIPKFLADKFKMIVSLFGQCFLDDNVRSEFKSINDSFNNRTAEQIAKEVLSDVTMNAARDPPIPKPYSLHFSQKELFNLINPTLNYNEDRVEELKDMFSELVINNYYKPCKEWHFDLKELKDVILSIPDEMVRREFYEKFNEIVADMKVNSIIFGPNYEDQKMLLVRNVLLSMADSMDKVIVSLSDAIFYTSYDLDFNEVLVTNPRLQCGKDQADENNDKKSICVVKSKTVRDKKQQAFNEALYVHTHGLICTAVEQIVSIIEGMKLL